MHWTRYMKGDPIFDKGLHSTYRHFRGKNMTKITRVGVVMVLLSVGYAANQEGSGSLKPSGAPTADVTGSWAIYYYAETDTKDSMDLTQRGTVLQGVWHARD